MSHSDAAQPNGSAREVFLAFLTLGVTSFGGPVAHIGYFREEFVHRRGWMDEAHFAQLLAVCQFLPGPASSQMGFAIGLLRAGAWGALAAFVAFTLPSALLLFGFAAMAPSLAEDIGQAAIHGLKLVAVVVVAHGVTGMARQLTPDTPRRLIGAASAALVLVAGVAWVSLAAIALGALAGSLLCRNVALPASAVFPVRYGRGAGLAFFAVFLGGLAGALTLPATGAASLPALAAAFYQAGALVFGGGHVVLPLLQEGMVSPGWITPEDFLAGYGAAQAVPGPMFAVAAYLGATVAVGLPPAVGALVALLALFLPGFLLLLALLPAWSRLAAHAASARLMAGTNAAVVGLLAAALYDPLWTSAVRGAADLAIVAAGFFLLFSGRMSSIWIVAGCVAGSVAVAVAGG
jgi:chromate transporter